MTSFVVKYLSRDRSHHISNRCRDRTATGIHDKVIVDVRVPARSFRRHHLADLFIQGHFRKYGLRFCDVF